ncbi:MAG: phosphate ABC transporter permease PstA [Planctomycetaceae bacterium]|nr:phosphate ABC transporter permease PstA [Planctomycetaceae bacterium]
MGGALLACLLMIAGLVVLILWQGFSTFWPEPLERVVLRDGRTLMGEVTRVDSYAPRDEELADLPPAELEAARAFLRARGGEDRRRLLRTGNFEVSGEHFVWVGDHRVAKEDAPEWAVEFERLTWGRFYGFPKAFLEDGKEIATGPEASWKAFQERHGGARARWRERRSLEHHGIGRVNRVIEEARLDVRRAELAGGPSSPGKAAAEEAFAAVKAGTDREIEEIRGRIAALAAANARHALRVETADGKVRDLALEEIVRAFPANRVGLVEKAAIYLSRSREFLLDEPREANSEGGVWPAIFGTVTMTLLMSLAVVPFGVLAALYLREYAKAGPVVSAVRIAVNNLAGVPSIVFGVFGLGFFCYIVGGGIDRVLFEERLPTPTFGTGGILWASLTLALLTLPVVIVATEEALSAVPSSMREGSYACGASKWQTIRRIVLPRAMPGILTGMILAMARGAGEVAPLMVTGAVKLAPELPVDGVFPFVHAQRSFMHLGFHVYDLGFQSQNSEAAKPMVYTTTLLLILVILALNLAAVLLRTRLRRKFEGSQF